jgi:hypothetical protein
MRRLARISETITTTNKVAKDNSSNTNAAILK